MDNRYKIALSVSLILTSFFVIPWITLVDNLQRFEEIISQEQAKGRLVYMGMSVFVCSMLFFQYHFFWKEKFLPKGGNIRKTLASLLVQIILLVFLSGFLSRASIKIFHLDKNQVFVSVMFARNVGIAMVVGLCTYAYQKTQQSKAAEIKMLTLNNEKVSYELAMLKSQINPHFLFNTFNSLIDIIRQNPEEGIRFVNHLSATFRYTLEKQATNLVTIQDELHFLKSYFYMEKARFGDALQIIEHIEKAHLSRRIPQFGLQALVENAIKHNVISEKKPLYIKIESNHQNIQVSNNLQLKHTTVKGYGIGLSNLNKRYQLLSNQTIEILSHEKSFTVIIPLL